jgi:dipeptidyl aminopeptidase/acylaminoacyl peptidase
LTKGNPSSQIRRSDLTTKVTDTLVEESGRRFAVSSNREELYFTRQDQIWHKRLKTGEELRLANLDEILRGVSWDLKDDRLYLITRREKPGPTLFRLELPGGLRSGRVEEVMELDAFVSKSISASSPGFAISPNGRAIASTSISSSDTEIRFLKYVE